MSESLPPRVTFPPSATPPPLASLAPPPRRSWSVWLVAALIVLGTAGVALVGLGFLGWGILNRQDSLLAVGHPGANHLREILIADQGAREKIAVIELKGVISGSSGGLRESMVDSIRHQLDRAAGDKQVRAVVLRVDSPGGEVLASDEIYAALRAFQGSNHLPVIACMGSLAASGGYYVSAPCRWIVAHPLTLTGSIGVIFHGYNFRGLMDKLGIMPDVVKSGPLKDMFSGERRPEDVLPEEKLILGELVKESFDRFKQVIRDGRAWSAEQNRAGGIKDGRELAADWETLADGRILSGTQALAAGLVDELGDFDLAVRRALQLVGLKSANLISYQAPPSLGDFLGLWGRANSSKVQIELPGLSSAAGLAPGRLYFVSPLHVR